MESLGNVWDWQFFWGVFGFIFKTVSPFVLIPIAILCVGLLIYVVVTAVKASRSS